MKTDIYGNSLRPGHCEVHPQVAEEYPCSLCIKEREIQQQLRRQMPNYILESQAQAAHQAGHAIGLPAGSDITTALVPAIQAVVAQRDELLAALEEIASCDPYHQSSAGIIARAAIAKAKGSATEQDAPMEHPYAGKHMGHPDGDFSYLCGSDHCRCAQ